MKKQHELDLNKEQLELEFLPDKEAQKPVKKEKEKKEVVVEKKKEIVKEIVVEEKKEIVESVPIVALPVNIYELEESKRVSVGTIRCFPSPKDEDGNINEIATGYRLTTRQTGIFTMSFYMHSESDHVDGIVSFNDSATEMGLRSRRSIEIRMNGGSNRFEAFNDGVGWRADTDVSFVKNQEYLVSVTVNLTTAPRTYSVSVGGITIATGYAMRNSMYSGQPVDNIAHLGLSAYEGIFAIRNFSLDLDGPWRESDTLPVESNNPVNNPNGTRSFYVGPGRAFEKVQHVLSYLRGGDTVYIQGDYDYPASVIITNAMHGTSGLPTSFIGQRVNDRRPKLVSLTNDAGIAVDARDVLLRGIEIEGDVRADNLATINHRISYRGVIHGENNLTILDCCIHNTIMGVLSGANPGNITVEHSEFYECGYGAYEHNLYIQYSQNYPDAVARFRFNYIHHSLTSMGIKSRSRRNEIYYNLFENNYGNQVELIGMEFTEAYLRAHPSDSDVVGNVFIANLPTSAHMRVGGDGTGAGSFGRFRISNNTFVTSSSSAISAIRMFMGIQSVEAYNNVFYNYGAGTLNILNDQGANWASGYREAFGSHNWLRNAGVSMIPSEWLSTVYGTTPEFTNVTGNDFTLSLGSPLVAAGTTSTTHTWNSDNRPDHVFLNPLYLPEYVAVTAATYRPGSQQIRRDSATPSIGAFGSYNYSV